MISERAKRMWEDLHEVMSNEVAWAIIERHLERGFNEAYEDGYLAGRQGFDPEYPIKVNRDCDTEGAVAQADGEEK